MVILIILICAWGVALTYGLNRVHFARSYRTRTGKSVSRRVSLALVGGWWIDGAVLLVLLISLPRGWIPAVIGWSALNFVGALTVVRLNSSRRWF